MMNYLIFLTSTELEKFINQFISFVYLESLSTCSSNFIILEFKSFLDEGVGLLFCAGL